jgi:hypothetical protein
MTSVRNVRGPDSEAAPALRLDLNMGTLMQLPAHASGPRPDDWAAIRAAGYEGLQVGDLSTGAGSGLPLSGMGRVDAPADAGKMAKYWANEGAACGTVHVGHGYEDDDEAVALLEACVEASAVHGVPIYVELHRATITQDPWRTLQYVKRVPDIRFNADFSHWYTGGEMVYGDFGRRVEALGPVLDRVRFIHGRISTPGQIQATVDGTEAEEPTYVAHFRELWTRAAQGFLADAQPGDVLPFAVELLPPSIYYALRDDQGHERGDRWAQASYHCEVMHAAFEAARPAAG